MIIENISIIMLNHFNTKLQNKKDFISLYLNLHESSSTKEEIIQQIKNQKNYWNQFLENLMNDILNSNYDFPDLIRWVENLENFLKIHQYFPSIDNLASLMCMNSFDGHHIYPHYNESSQQVLDYFGYNQPDVLLNFLGYQTRVVQKELLNSKIEPKPIHKKEFSIVRIQSNLYQNKNIFIDLKVREFNKKDFLFKILTLPEFWRNFHFVSRKKKFQNFTIHPAYSFNKILNSFYIPSDIYNINSFMLHNKKNIIDNLKINKPLHINIYSFSTHLFFTMPGLVLPLTYAEQQWSAKETPDLTIQLQQGEMTLVSLNYSNSHQENQEVITEFSKYFSQKEESFSNFFDIGSYSGGQFIINQNQDIAFIYEANMIAIFESLTKFDKHIS